MALSDLDRKILDMIKKQYETSNPPVTGKRLRDVIIYEGKWLENPVDDEDLKDYLRSKSKNNPDLWDASLEKKEAWEALKKKLGPFPSDNPTM